MWKGSRESLIYMDLSHNFLIGFENNRINLPLPKLSYLDISSNLLETALPTPPPSVNYYNISNNFLFGEIQSICRGRSLVILDLSINSLNGTIPSCLGNIDSLSILNLGKNKLEGMIPHAYPKGCALKMIDLTENRLQGPVPRSLANCTMLEYLNLGYNQILDGFPLGLLELTKLKAIILKSNKFHGPIEAHRSQFNFSNLHILDLSNNRFNGELPSKLLQSFHAMKVIVAQDHLQYIGIVQFYGPSQNSIFAEYEMRLMNKGIEREYSKVPYALMGIDLSNNKFEGHISDLVGDLKSLIWLNLSNNILTGCIPPSLANLTILESLDLSQNKLSGEIPQQLVQLTFLSSFNVSHNRLSGRIPQGSQFNTFGIDSYAMNEGLCGSPLPKNCRTTVDIVPISPPLEEENGEQSLFDLDWKVVLIGIGVGFMVGVVLGNLIIDEKSRWFLHYSKRMRKRWKRLGRR
ncbi:receptor-like protein 39 [Syzygium oleosum]|uniref:receptor-like protein 39 n=1 Tax=Syzygium oleosum TaxID=219896 RepID=UPI0024BA3194|nr:receptor-like protein 39 [Syzygium oleosum]